MTYACNQLLQLKWTHIDQFMCCHMVSGLLPHLLHTLFLCVWLMKMTLFFPAFSFSSSPAYPLPVRKLCISQWEQHIFTEGKRIVLQCVLSTVAWWCPCNNPTPGAVTGGPWSSLSSKFCLISAWERYRLTSVLHTNMHMQMKKNVHVYSTQRNKLSYAKWSNF